MINLHYSYHLIFFKKFKKIYQFLILNFFHYFFQYFCFYLLLKFLRFYLISLTLNLYFRLKRLLAYTFSLLFAYFLKLIIAMLQQVFISASVPRIYSIHYLLILCFLYLFLLFTNSKVIIIKSFNLKIVKVTPD